MSLEAWLAFVAFGVLMTLWLVLPSRFIHRNRNSSALLRPSEEAPSPTAPEARGQEEAPARPAQGMSRNGVGRASWTLTAEVRLTRNKAFSLHDSAGEPRYYFLVQLEGFQEEARIPVYWRPSPSWEDPLLKEVYEAEVAGRWLRAGNLQALQGLLTQTLGELLRTRLPAFWLIPPKGQPIPVYIDSGSLVATVPAGPRIVDRTLGGLRAKFCHYLALANGADVDRLTVAKLSPYDLRIHRPVAVFAGEGAWIPVFHLGSHLSAEESADAEWRHEGNPGGLLALWCEVCEELHRAGRIPRPDALAISDLSEPMWEGLQTILRPTGFTLTDERAASPGERKKVLPVWRWEGIYFCKTEARGICLYASPDPWELCTRLGMDLRREREVPRAPGSILGLTSIMHASKEERDGQIAASAFAQPPGRASSRTDLEVTRTW